MAGKTIFKFRDAAWFDFSKAPIYRKSAMLAKNKVKIATRRQEVVTAIDGLQETRNVARVGDRIIRGDQGERYVLTARKFAALYEIDAAKPSVYRAKGRVRALTLTENTEIRAPWGERQRAAKGGVIVRRVGRPLDIYLIEKRAFRQTYVLEKQPPARRRG